MLLPSAEKWWDVTVNKTVKTSSIWKIRYCNTRGLTGTASQAVSGCRAGPGGCVSEEGTHKAAGWPPGTDPKPPRLVGPSPAHHGSQPLSGPHGRSTVRTVGLRDNVQRSVPAKQQKMQSAFIPPPPF